MIKKIYHLYSNAFSGLPAGAWALSAVILINRSGSMVLFFMALYLTGSLHYSVTDAGSMITIYGLGAIVGSFLGGRLSDSVGTARVQVFSLLLSGVVLIFLGYIKTLTLIGVFLFVLAVISESFRPANATAIAQICPPENRARCYGLNRMAINIGVTVGPAIGGFLATLDYLYIFWVDGVTCIVAGVILEILYLRGKIETHKIKSKPGKKSTSPYRDFAFHWFMLLLFFMGFVFSQIFSTWPLFLKQENHFNENIVGVLLALNAIFVTIIEMPLIHRFEKADPLKIIMIGAIFFYVGFAILPLNMAFWFAALSVITWSIGEVLIFPLATSFVAGRGDEGDIGKYMGMYNFNFALSLVIGPLAGSWVYEHVGPDYVWYLIGGIGVLVLAGFRLLKIYLEKEKPATTETGAGE